MNDFIKKILKYNYVLVLDVLHNFIKYLYQIILTILNVEGIVDISIINLNIISINVTYRTKYKLIILIMTTFILDMPPK